MAKEYLDKLTVFIEKATADGFEDVDIECKHFFSGAAVYVEKKICISLTPVGLAIKLPEETKNKLFKNNQAIPLRYFPSGPIKKDYALFPGGITKSTQTLRKYVKQSIAYVFTKPK